MNTYPKLVIEEATAIRIHASKEEISRLNFESFDPDSPVGCIYGQMTYSCYSLRAIELIEKCATRVYNKSDSEAGSFKGFKLNGSPIGMRRLSYLSPF